MIFIQRMRNALSAYLSMTQPAWGTSGFQFIFTPCFEGRTRRHPSPACCLRFLYFRSVCVCVCVRACVRAWGVLCIIIFGSCGSISTNFRRRNFCKFIYHLILLERLSSFSCSSFGKKFQGMNGGGRMRELLAICLRLYLCLLQQRTSKFRDRAIFCFGNASISRSCRLISSSDGKVQDARNLSLISASFGISIRDSPVHHHHRFDLLSLSVTTEVLLGSLEFVKVSCLWCLPACVQVLIVSIKGKHSEFSLSSVNVCLSFVSIFP
jgi:hypothetical protein